MNLYHRTCDHGRAGIGRAGVLRPNPHPFIPGASLVWLTDSREAGRDALGLTSESLLTCDRMRYLYATVGRVDAVPWLGSRVREAAPADVVAELEAYSDPARWWIATVPVRVRLAGVGGR